MIFRHCQINPDDLENDDILRTITNIHHISSDAYDKEVVRVGYLDRDSQFQEQFVRVTKGQYWVIY